MVAKKKARKAVKKPAKKAAPKRQAANKAAKPGSTRKIIEVPGARARTVPLSNAVQVGNILFVSGSTPYDADGKLVENDFEAQMHQVMKNLEQILTTAGSSFDKVAKVVVFLADMGNFWKMNEIYRQYFKEGNYPARSTMQTVLALPTFMLEIECIAEV
jgi:2-iminobutanoate/2-iminopropanoate deaminase